MVRALLSYEISSRGNRYDAAPPATELLSGAVRAQACIDVCLATVAPDSCHDTAGDGSEDKSSGSDEHEHGAPLSKKSRADGPCGG
jgi:hypothetical protein